MALLGQRLRELAPTSAVDLSLSMQPQPFCDALRIAGPGYGLPTGPLHVSLNIASKVYKDGETLIVTVTSSGKGGHLTVDHLDLSGNVVHMVPMPLRPNGQVRSGQSITLGAHAANAERTARVYTISPPFGPGMILAVLTPKPLFPANRPEVEPAADYLPRLRAALAAALEIAPGTTPASASASEPAVVSDAVFFTTVPR